MTFSHETPFEIEFTKLLSEKGWEKEVLMHPSEEDLIQNWAQILFDNNRDVDRLNDVPLTSSEMQQILEQITALRTPLKLNGFINGRTVSIVRDNPLDTLHVGKEVSLKIYDKREIAAGQSRYQIVRQPHFKRKIDINRDRRGDVLLLINGMPVIHIELKRSGIPLSNACSQIEKYSREGVFTGLFSLVQIFVAMTPEESQYFANAGPDGKFNRDYYFTWADFNNEPIQDWKSVTSSLLSIPMAHQMIGFYTIADGKDDILKVMRSYQFYAASAISDTVAKTDWTRSTQRGGYIWHTTGSGKTMTSFKSAQLIANSQDADKVIFLLDRVELGTQSLKAYSGFVEANESIQDTKNTAVLIAKLKSSAHADTLIVTSIQKMSNINDEYDGLKGHDLELINAKRVVFIVDEAHRSTFGEMLQGIKKHFPRALFFGFTGTPIKKENQKKMSTTSQVFGNELHRYSIADGIRDKNVLPFDTYKILTYQDSVVRKVIALEKAKAANEVDAISDPEKAKVYYHYMDSSKVPMAGDEDDNGKYTKGIEDYLPNAQYRSPEHQNMVVKDIAEQWITRSRNGEFHAIFATSSIPEAITYYRLLKEKMPHLKTTCLFDPHEAGENDNIFKAEGLKEIIKEYGARYDQNFDTARHAAFKIDVASRMAHDEPYIGLEKEPAKQLDMLIVVDQMLTGFDSKWVNTLYLDKNLKYENIIQAFSRTNRLFGESKPSGIIRYYRRPHTMARDIKRAVKLYSGDKPLDLFVDKLPQNIERMNAIHKEITDLFVAAGVTNFEKLPEEREVRGKFVSLFNAFNAHLEAAKVQGFTWDGDTYDANTGDANTCHIIEQDALTSVQAAFTQTDYFALMQRYRDLASENDGGTSGSDGDAIPYDLKGYSGNADQEYIDTNYMNSRFNKYLKMLKQDQSSEAMLEEALGELHKSFATLSQEEQKYANIFLRDVQRGDAEAEAGKTLRDYITEYQCEAKNTQIDTFASTLGMDKEKLQKMMMLHLSDANINEFGRFDELKTTVDKVKAKEYFESLEGKKLPPPHVNMKLDKLLRDFILRGGFEL